MTSSRIALSIVLLVSLAACGGRRARVETQLGVVPSEEALQVMAPTGPEIGCTLEQLRRGGLLMHCPTLDGSGTIVDLRIDSNDRGDAFAFQCASGAAHLEACRAIYDRLRQGPTGGGEAAPASDAAAEAAPASEAGADTQAAPSEG